MAKRATTKPRRRSGDKPLRRLIGERVRTLRDEQGLARTTLAQRSGVALTSLNLLEAGRVQPSLQTLELLAKTLDVRVADLVSDEPVPPKKRSEGTKVLGRIIDRLRDRDPSYLDEVEKLLSAFDGAVAKVSR